jgi:hypothetical protein
MIEYKEIQVSTYNKDLYKMPIVGDRNIAPKLVSVAVLAQFVRLLLSISLKHAEVSSNLSYHKVIDLYQVSACEDCLDAEGVYAIDFPSNGKNTLSNVSIKITTLLRMNEP